MNTNNNLNQDLDKVLFSLNMPDSFRIDTGFADSIKTAALCSAECCEASAALNDDESADVEEIDLAVRLRSAITCGEIDPVHAFDAAVFVLQAVCSVTNGDISVFFREHVAGHLADFVRSDSPIVPEWNDSVDYPEFEFDPESLNPDIDVSDPEVVRNAQVALTPSLLRLGAMLTNLKLEPVGVTTSSEAEEDVALLTQWSVGAALQAFLGESFGSDGEPSEGELAAILIVALAELFDWLDANIVPGLAHAAKRHITHEFIPQRIKPSDTSLPHATNIVEEAA